MLTDTCGVARLQGSHFDGHTIHGLTVVQHVYLQTRVTVGKRILFIIEVRLGNRSTFDVFESIHQALRGVDTTPTQGWESFPANQIPTVVACIELAHQDELIAAVSYFPEELGVLTCVVLVPQFVGTLVHHLLGIVGSHLPVAIVEGGTGLHGQGGTLGDTSIVGSRPADGQVLNSLVKVVHHVLIDFVARSAGDAFLVRQFKGSIHIRYIAKGADKVEVVECAEEVGLSKHFLLLSLVVVGDFVNLAQNEVSLTDYAVGAAPALIQGIVDTFRDVAGCPFDAVNSIIGVDSIVHIPVGE